MAFVPFTGELDQPKKQSSQFVPFTGKLDEEPQEESGFFRQAADIPVNIAKGVTGGVRMIADVFGAGSDVSEGIKGVEDYLGGLLSAQAKNDQKEISRIMKEAEDKGKLEQVIAGVKAFAVAPIDTLSQALGTSAPAIVAGLATTLTGGAPLVVAGVTAGVGAGMGAGAIKGTIYEATKEELIKAGVKPDVAEKAATEAQAYGGENLDQILLGAGIGAVAARTGIERAILGKAITKDVAKKGVTRAAAEEAAPEAVQAGQEQIAENLALQRQGFDVPLTRGVYSAATLEALAGAGLGAGVDLATRGEAVDKGPRTKEDDQIDALRNMKVEEDVGEVISPETKDAARQPEQRPSVRDDGRAVEPSVSMPVGVDEAAPGVVETEAGRVGGVGGPAVEPAVGAEEVDTTLVEQGLEGYLDPDTEALRQNYVNNNTNMLDFAEAAEANDAYQDALQQNLANLPDTVTLYRGRAKDGSYVGEAGPYINATLSKSYAENFRNVLGLPASEWVVEPITVPKSNIIALGSASENEFILKKPAAAPAPEETISGQQGQPSLAITPSGTLGLKDLVKIEDPKLQTKFEEISAGKKKVYKDKGYTPLFQELQQTIDGLSQFLAERGVDPTNLADLRAGTPEIQNAAKLLNALGQDASNITQAVKNQEIKYASAKTPEAKAQVSDQFVKNNLESARQTIQTVNNFIQDPSKGTGQLAVFSNVREAAPGTRGSEARLVREAVGQIVQDWENAPRVEVVQSISELPGYMQEQITRDKVNPQGAYDPVSNLVFLVADNLRGREDVFTTVAHEALGHFGLRSILGDSYNRVMNEIYNGHKDVKKAADEKMKGTAKVSKEIAVEEVLAEMAETAPKPTPALRRLFDAIRRFARKLGIPLRTVTDSDLQQLVANASRYVRRNAMKFDPFTKGQVQPGGPRAVTGDKAVFDVVKRDSKWSIDRIRQLFSTFAYDREDNDTKAYAGFVRPSEFLEATTTPDELAAMREQEFTKLNKRRLADFEQPIFLEINFETGKIIGHEGRHRMMALQDAGVSEVPVVFINGDWGGKRVTNAKQINRVNLEGQESVRGQGRGFTATDLIPISWANSERIKETFGGEADVVFSALPPAAKNVEAVYSQGFKTPAGPARVNPGNAPTLMEKLSKGRPLWPEVKGKFNLKAITSLPPSAKQAMYKLLTLRMLKDIVGARLPQIGRAITVSEQMVSERGRIMREGADILDKLEVLRKEKNGGKQIRLLGELQVQATMLEIDPDPKSKFHKPNKTLTDAWNTLSPKAQEIYQDMREFYTTQVDGMVDDMKARIDRNFPKDSTGKENPKATKLKKEIDDEFGPSKRKGPYFPLRRFGQYWFQVGKGDDKEFYMFESINDRDFWMAERAKELVAEKKAANEEEATRDLISAGNSLREGEDSLNNALANEPLMKKIEALVDDAAKTMTTPNMQTKAVDDLKDGLKQLQYLLLPSTNIRKAFIHRKGIAGASADVGRVFSTSVVNLAYQRARVKYAEQFYDNIDNAYGYLEGAPNTEETRTLRDLVNELNSRSAHILGMEPTSVSDKVANGVTQFSFLWLLTAPASSIINIFGAATVGSSYIGARYGYPETFAKMTKYGGKYLATAPKVTEGNTVFPTLDKTTNLNPVERAAYDRFLHDNAVDVSLTQDIMGLSQAPYEQYSAAKFKIVQGISSIFHHSERMSREVMNMAAFDLAYADNVRKGMAPGVDGPAFNAAIETAKDLTFMSIGDFSRSSKPPVLTKPIAKVLFQFKQYSLLMTYNILRNTMIGFNPRRKNLTDEQKAEAREARRRMYGTLGITALFAGAKGMPIFTAVAFLAEALQTAFGDDEEEYIFEYAMKDYLTESFGGEVAASMMTGLIANQLNVGISERMSLDLIDLWIRDSGYQRSAEDSAKEFMLSNLGPAVSIGLNFTKAVDQWNNSQEMRALETASPIIARNLLTVGRWIREEENATARGITIDDDITYSDLVVRALGFTPEDMLRKQKEIIDRKGLENKIEYKRERLLGALYVALHTGDDDLFERTMEKVADFNEKYPEDPIKFDTIKKSLKRKLEDKAKQEALGGVGEKLYERIERAIPRSE